MVIVQFFSPHVAVVIEEAFFAGGKVSALSRNNLFGMQPGMGKLINN